MKLVLVMCSCYILTDCSQGQDGQSFFNIDMVNSLCSAILLREGWKDCTPRNLGVTNWKIQFSW